MAGPTLDRGTALRITVNIKDGAGTLTNPGTITCEIMGPTGATYTAAAQMTNSSTGVYLLDVQTAVSDTTGLYEIIVRATSNSLTSLFRDTGFKLE